MRLRITYLCLYFYNKYEIIMAYMKIAVMAIKKKEHKMNLIKISGTV
jgi:hypothetical protein